MDIPNHYYLTVVEEQNKSTIDIYSVPYSVRQKIIDLFAEGYGLVCISQGPKKNKKVLLLYTDDKSLSRVISDKYNDIYSLTPFPVTIEEKTLKWIGGRTEPKVEITNGFIYGAKLI